MALITDFLLYIPGHDRVRIGLVKFSNRGNLVFTLNRYNTSRDIERAIKDMSYSGGLTNTAGGIRKALDEIFTTEGGDRPNVANTMIVVTDGASNVEDDGNTNETAREARQQ